MLHKINRFLPLVMLAVISVSLSSCEDKNGISTKDASVVDFMELYGKSTDDVDALLVNYHVSKDNVNEDGNTYWHVTKKKNELYTTLNSKEVFISITFIDNKCSIASIMYRNTDSDYLGLNELQTKYGKGEQIDRNVYDWYLEDGSTISYFGTILGSGRKTLIIYREAQSTANIHQKVIFKELENLGIE